MIRPFLRRHQLFLLNFTSASGLLASSDLCVQLFYEQKQSLDGRRLFAALATGAAMGVEGHIWYSYLDRVIAHTTWKSIAKKVLLDQSIAAPVYTLTYILGTSMLEGRTSSPELSSDVRTNLLPLFIADCVINVPAQIFNFKYISPFYRLPFLSVVGFLFDTFITAYKHKHE